MNVLLVVAEDRAICESLRAALPETDLVLFESTLDAALRRLISMKVDAVLIDDAPQLGHQAIARFFETAPDTPVIVLSSRSDAESLASWTLAGARACVVKPFSCEALRGAVEGVLRRRDQALALFREAANAAASVAATRPELSGPGETPKLSVIGQHQMALRWISRISNLVEDPRRLSQSLVDSAMDIFDVVRCAVLLDMNGSVRVAGSYGIPSSVAQSLRLSYGSGLMRWFEENACLFDRVANANATDAVKEMQVLGGRLAVPFLSTGRVCGAFVVGEKASGCEYTFEERELLSVVSRCASAAFEKAREYRDTSNHRSRLDRILANITSGVVTVLPNKTVAMMNQQAERILQVRAVDVLGRSVQQLGSGFADIVLRTLADGKPRLRQEIHDPALKAMVGLSATPMGPEGVVVIFSKLPEETVSRQELAYSPFWEYLSARVAQEIKNPMVAINTFAQLLPRKYDSEDFRDAFFRVVQKEVARINTVVETLFGFARQPELTLERTDINESLRGVLRGFEEALAERSIRLEAELNAETVEADLDPVFFAQALQNVIQNAVEAMPEGGALKVSTQKHDNTCEIIIADTGPGVPQEEAPLIFMPFYSTKERGMGLGLSTAQRIVKQHNGDLKIVERPEHGAAFAVTVPASNKENNEDDFGN